MEELRISFTEMAIYTTVLNVILGVLFGTFPLILGIKMKNRNYGVYGFISSIIGGAVLGFLLSYPISIIFIWLILRNLKPENSPTQVSSDSDIS